METKYEKIYAVSYNLLTPLEFDALNQNDIFKKYRKYFDKDKEAITYFNTKEDLSANRCTIITDLKLEIIENQYKIDKNERIISMKIDIKEFDNVKNFKNELRKK